MLISIDFDGTMVKHRFPEVGEWMPECVRVLKRIQAAGHRLILNTCRENEKRRAFLDEAVAAAEKEGITFVSINCNDPEDDFREKGGRKVYAHIYIDDRNFGGFPGWLAIEKWMEENGHLKPTTSA